MIHECLIVALFISNRMHSTAFADTMDRVHDHLVLFTDVFDLQLEIQVPGIDIQWSEGFVIVENGGGVYRSEKDPYGRSQRVTGPNREGETGLSLA